MHHCPSTVLEKDITKRWLQSRNLLDQEWEGVPKTPKAAQKGRMAVWAVLQKMKEEGKVRHLGVSNYTRRHLRLLAEDNQLRMK